MKKTGYEKFNLLLIELDIDKKKLAIELGISEKAMIIILLGKGKDFTFEQFKIIRDIFNIKLDDYF